MTLLCLVGRHGAGKSTIGEQLAAAGFHHISVGLLRRLARSGQYPADVPLSLMTAMRRSRAGAPLSTPIAKKLVDYAGSFKNCVLDGFPASIEHLELLPAHATIGVVWVPKHLRYSRLEHRSLLTLRQWVPGRHSEREQNLPNLITQSKAKFKTIFVPNAGDPHVSAALVKQKVLVKP